MSYGIRRKFYKSKQWQLCRESYLASVGRLCEECLKEGRITPAVIVHHKQPLTDDTVLDPDVALGFDNLEAVCMDHHAKLHSNKKGRYKLDDIGRVIIIE